MKRVDGDKWVTARADRVKAEEVIKAGASEKFLTIINWSQNRRLPMAAMHRRDCHLDEDDPKGMFTAEEVDALVREFHPPRGARAAELGIMPDMRLASREPAAGYKWLSVSEGDGLCMNVRLGDEVTLGASDVVINDKAMHYTESAKGKGMVFCQQVKVADVANFRKSFRGGLKVDAREPGGDAEDKEADDEEPGAVGASPDARLLPGPVSFKAGVRYRPFAEAAGACDPEVYDDFPVSGGRNMAWLLDYVQRNGGTFEGRQTKWSYENGVDKDEAAYRIHDLAGRALEVGLTYDQLDITNSAMAEVIGRMYSLVEETNGSMVMEGVEYFVGRDESSSRMAVAPGLRKHQSDKLERDVNVAKNQRKAREELQGMPRGPKKPKGPKPT